ncbi:hypothetical protein BGZ63DRAFT_375688 [Mariannaea sp. PMI_226]|nr:hypothetical protein BGZ63DRAFT_375688 [Mariannaea sp. PMI_226]
MEQLIKLKATRSKSEGEAFVSGGKRERKQISQLLKGGEWEGERAISEAITSTPSMTRQPNQRSAKG